MASLSNSSWQNRKERPKRSKNKGDMVEKGKCLPNVSVDRATCNLKKYINEYIQIIQKRQKAVLVFFSVVA